MDSILTSIKKLLGIAEDYTCFDVDIIMHINTVFSILTQLGVGPSEGFTIQDEDSVWSDFISDRPNLEMVKTYVGMKVRMMFDPPSSSITADAFNKAISELEWRINLIADSVIQNGGE